MLRTLIATTLVLLSVVAGVAIADAPPPGESGVIMDDPPAYEPAGNDHYIPGAPKHLQPDTFGSPESPAYEPAGNDHYIPGAPKHLQPYT